MDFRFFQNNIRCGIRATALLVKDNHLYATKYRDIYTTIGGAVLIDETTQDAVAREVLEEINAKIEVKQLAYVVENFFWA